MLVPKPIQYVHALVCFYIFLLYMQTHIPETKKAAYRWLGCKAISENRFLAPSASVCDRNEPKKRAFGTELTNSNAKRNKTDCSKDRKHYGNQNTSRVIKEEPCDVKPDVKNFAFGSSTPAGTSGMNNTGNNIRPRLGVLEALSSIYQPQYCNPGKNLLSSILMSQFCFL